MKKAFNKRHNDPPLEEFPNSIGADVEEVNIYRNQIRQLNLTKKYENIKKLDISDNKLTSLPENLNDFFSNLEILDLSFNLIDKIPSINIPKLKELYLHCNDIEYFLYNCEYCKELEENNEKGQIYCENLEVLDIASNLLHRIPTINSKNLKKLYLANNHIKEIDYEKINCLTSLEILSLESNLFTELDCSKLPETITHLLIAENEGLTTLKNVECLTNLKVLDIDATKISLDSVSHLNPEKVKIYKSK